MMRVFMVMLCSLLAVCSVSVSYTHLEPLTEAQRLKRQKMIVLPAMVLVFIGAMWLIFAPSSDKEQPPGTDGYNTEMPDADLSLIHISFRVTA